MNKFVKLLPLLALMLLMLACSESTKPDADPNDDIPGDPTGVVVPTPVNNTLKPVISPPEKTAGNPSRIRLNLLGMLLDDGTPFEASANSSLFVQEDSVVQGFVVGAASQAQIPIDMVFTVDNSGSMSQEADSIAAGITEFADYLVNTQNLDIRFGCVGYSGNVSGAVNLEVVDTLSAFLNRSTGTSRTRGYAGADADSLLLYGISFGGPGSENGIDGIFFAENYFNWRPNALRIYVNFTDEPTQPGGDFAWSTDSLCNYMAGNATVHTVWTGGDTTSFVATPLSREKPWEMSYCTGGETRVFDSFATGLNLLDLPVTTVAANSYVVEFVTSNPNQPHQLIITVQSGTDDGQTVYENITY